MPTTIESLILIALAISPGYICARFMRVEFFEGADTKPSTKENDDGQPQRT
jgi:hypothetical protein